MLTYKNKNGDPVKVADTAENRQAMEAAGFVLEGEIKPKKSRNMWASDAPADDEGEAE